MKPTSEICAPTPATGAPAVNAAGNPTGNMGQTFEITTEDVGQPFPNYRGFGEAPYTFQASDVGRGIVLRTHVSSDWTCWKFD